MLMKAVDAMAAEIGVEKEVVKRVGSNYSTYSHLLTPLTAHPNYHPRIVCTSFRPNWSYLALPSTGGGAGK